MNGVEVDDDPRPVALEGPGAGPRALLHAPFEEQAARTPEATALVDGGRRWTYAELNRRAEAIARHLVALGVRPDDRVGVCHDRSAGMLAALLGVLKAGGAYVPLDPSYPRERLAYTLEDSGAVALVTQEKLLAIVPETTAEIVLVESTGEGGEDLPHPAPAAGGAGPDNLAYVIYTSGSTGRPKGVAVEHRSLAAFLAWARTVFSPADLAGVFASTSISFDISVVELFLPLACGGMVILGENALALPGLPAASEVTLINTVPSAMSELIRLGALPPSARTVNLGGEALRRTLAERVYATGTVERLFNLYGPTEDTVYSTFLRVPREPAEPGEPAIGVAIDGTWTRLADPWFEAVPPGEAGELLLGGAGLARGYLDRPDLTAERFVPDPSSPEPGGRLYRTGDLARLRPDGELDYLGRIDHQVKIRGFRIELGEVESALQARAGVREAVVVAREDTPGDKRLVAYLAVDGGGSPAQWRAALRDALRERLPEHMVPSAFVFLETLPLTPNGKVDRKALPAPDLGAESREAVPPRNPTEALLAGIWERVLSWTGAVGVHDDFFDLGGHSLLAGRVVSQVRDALGIEITVRDLFEAPTPGALAERLEALGREENRDSAARLAPPIRPVRSIPGGRLLPLSHSQERLWLIERLSPGTSAYNVPTAIELRGALDVAAWTATLSEIVRRHEVLRTVYRPELDGAIQVVEPAAAVPVPVVDLAGLPEDAAGREGLRLAEEDARRPFDLERGPVLRAALLRLAAERWLALAHIHHIATDGWSAGVLASEIQALYPAVAAGRPSPLPKLAVQYADYAVWQRAWLEGNGAAAVAGQLDYWKKRLAGDTPMELPADRPRPAVFRYRGATLPLSLSATRIRPLRALARRSGGTLFISLAAGFQTLLARLSGQEMVSVGTPVAGRTRTEIEPLIGFFLNTVVLRTGLQGNPSFAEAVGRVRETALGAHANADVPFDRVVAELRPERGSGSSPLFQVLFVLDTTPFEALGLPGLETAELRPERGAAVFDLTMSLAERDEGVVGWLEYSSDLFDRATAERLAGFFATLLGGAALDPGTRLSDLPLLSPDERRQLVTDWSGAALPLPPRPETHHEWIERQTDRTPDAVALVFGKLELTYREMDERANRLAHRLIALGAGPEVRIGLYVDRSVEMAIAFLAVLKAGAAFVALDPFYPRERIAMMVEDSRLHLLLVQSALRGDAPLAGVEGVPIFEIEALEAEAEALVPQQNHRPDTGVSAHNLLYVVFTSGSTGRPKGIAMTHAGMLNALAWQLVSSRDLPSAAATLQFSSLNFDISFQEMISTWWTGGKMILIPGEQRLDPDAVLDLVLRHSIERLYLPPVFLQQLAQTVVDRGVDRLPVLEVYAAGEQLQVTPAVRAFFATMPPQAALHNQFGPSETHLTTQLSLPVSELQSWPALPAIGTVLPGVHVYLLDRAGQLVPEGVTGEVYIGGYGHARGYIGRPDLTADRFLPDPFSGLPGARLYKTGDLARYRPDGVLDFLGRSDSQVKIRGYRIEPLEVETVLAAHPEVEECAVVPRRSSAGELRLVAWVVAAAPEAAADSEALKRRLRDDLATKLPEVMVPARFVMADVLPKTPTGKLDRRSLAKVDLPEEEDAGSVEDAAPRTPTEELLTGLWARVLRQERVRIHDNFFELGGHSLIAAQIAARVRDTFGVDLPARAVFENPTPAAFASRIEAARGALSRVEIPPVVPVGRDRPLPVSFSQERLWFLEQVQPGGVNDVPLALRIEGPLDTWAWLASLAEVRRRHEALRTTFEVTLDGLMQRLTPAAEPWIQPVIDLSGLAFAQAETERARIASAEARWPFDLAAGPLIRALLVRLGPEDHAALLTLHHTVFDGWSVEVLLSELEQLYPAFLEGRPSTLPELAIQYPDFAVWQRQWMEGPGRPLIEAEIDYWRRHLAGAEEDTAVELPLDRPRPAQQSFEGGDVEIEIPAEAGLALRALGREVGATAFMALIAGLESLMVRLSGRGKVGVGTAIAGRNRVETEDLIGCFINSLVLRTDLSGDPAFAVALRRVREVTLDAYAHQEVPFARLIQELQPERSISATPFFQVVLIHVSTPPERLTLPGLRVIDQRAEHGVARLDLAFWLWEREDGGVTGWVEYSDDLFDRSTVERLVGTFRNVLVAGAAAPGSRLSELPLLSEVEQHQILEVWSGSPALAPGDSTPLTIYGAVAAQAARTAEAVAVTCRGESLTHGELDRRANRLARHLRAHGVEPEVRVGIYLERGLGLIVALLGVLKAGGSYVPLDPAHPRERLAGIVEDSRAAVLLTEAALRGSVPVGDAPVRILDLDEDRQAIAARPDAPLGSAADPDGLAYLLYTSGSTGRPKGVAIAHRTVVGFLRAIREVTGFGAEDVTLALATMSFDISVLEVFLPLMTGGRAELVGRQEAADAVLLAERIAAAGVTLLQATPPTWRLLVQSGWAATRPIQGLCGGEPLPRDLADLMLDRLGPEGKLWNVYGPTETTVWSSAGEVRHGGPIAVGPSVPGVRHYLLDPWLQPVPAGVPAEVFVGGTGVGRGYWNRPGLTAEAYLPDPFAPAAGARLYRTGDLGRWLPDGRIDLLGRADFQVKVRGFRIELGEIEGVLGEHPQVRERAVIAHKEGNDTRLVAFFVTAGEPLAVTDLRDFLRRRLPDYMVPSAFFQIDRLPLNVNGKVDRKALLALEAAAPAEAGLPQGHEAPRTFVEELLVRSWTEVLGRERVGVRDNFFDLGGHSLLAAQIIARVQAAFGVRLPMRAIFEAPTPAALAEAVERALRARSGAAGVLPPIVSVRRDGRALPLSFAQEQLWFLSQIQSGAVYNLPYALRLAGRLDVAAWQDALAGVRHRHEALRTTFPARPEGGAFQRLTPPGEPWLQSFLDLSELPAAVREAEAARLAAVEAARPFDLAAGPLLRAALIRLSPDDHLALLTVHHIVVDGWSTGLLLGEVERLYGALAGGRSASATALPRLPVQYADYAIWQREWMRDEALAAPLAYWRSQLAGVPELELPADRPRPAAHTFRGGIVTFTLPAAQTARLADLARSAGGTLFMVLAAGLQAILHRLSGSLDFTVGTAVANRGRTEIESLVGFFANVLVLRANLAGDPTFAELLERVRETALAAYSHQDVPFEKLVEELRPKRRLDQNPLFQVAFTFQHIAMPSFAGTGLRVTDESPHSGTSKFDLSLFVGEDENGLHGLWEYSSDLFDRATIERLAGHSLRLLEGVAADPGQRVSTLEILSESESRQLFSKWNPQVSVALPWPSLHAGFAAQAARTPGAVAVSGEEGSLTYKELNERADRLASRLRAEGVGPEVLVGLCAERSLDLIVGLLGVLKAGGAYVPLDPAYPQERLAFIVEDTAAPVIVIQEHLRDRLPAIGPRLVGIEESGEGAPARAQEAGPENAAYVIYTSGSTGRPKGVVVTHANALRLFAATDPGFDFGPRDTWTLFHSYAFDFSVWEIWGALLYGGRLVVVPYFVSRSPEAFSDLLRRERVTVLNQTPSAFDALARAVLPSGEALPDLRTVVFGGEAISLRALEPWLDRFGEAPRLVNMYGITETTVHVTYRPLIPSDPRSGETPFGSPIGQPIPDLAVHVVDRAGRPVPVGVPGEMRVGGAGLARGYLNRPDLTAERFVPDSFSGRPGVRLYRSGDLARRLPSGHLEFLGRADAQVKIRGFRIEPGEIEAALARLPEVAACAVLPRQEPQGDAVLAAYVVPRSGSSLPSPRRLREELVTSLPDYMVPALFIEIPALPVTPSGKVDRRALAQLTHESGAGTAEGYAAPRTPTEEALAGVWLEVLGADRTGGRIGIHDDFFARGGHSLLATRLVNRIRSTFGIDLPLRALFEASTPARLAEKVDAALLAAAGSLSARSAPPIVPVGRDRDLPLSFAQERLWFLDQLQTGNHYNVPLALRLTGPLDLAAWKGALEEIRRRHEALRTRFQGRSGSVAQVVDPAGPWLLPVIDLAVLPAAHREREARRLAQAESERRFDLAAGPVARASLYRLGKCDHVSLLTFHHIVSDGWSMGVLMAELQALYSAFAAGRTSTLPDLPVQYADFAAWQRRWLSGETLEAQLDYWRERLAGEPFLTMPADRPAPPAQTFRGTSFMHRLPADLAADLADLGRRSGATLFMVLLAAFDTLIHRYTGNLDLVVGSPIAGRNRPEIEGLIGFFVNTLVLRSDLSGDPTFEGLLRQVRETALGAYAHQDLPFEKLVEELRPERRLDQNPIFQVVLSFERLPPLSTWQGVEVSPFELTSWSAKFDLDLAVIEEETGLTCWWEYKTDLYDEATIARTAGHWARLLAAMTAEPERRIGELPLLTQEESDQLLREWNPQVSATLPWPSLHAGFAAQAARTPEGVAVSGEEGSLTYRELNDRANRLADRLRVEGVGPDVLVGLCAERSLDLIVGLLGILKAGGAYVPLDPAYPQERLAFIAQDTAAPVIVVQNHLRDRLPETGTRLVGIRETGEGAPVPALEAGPENAAYVIYTSGSTGRPKGVVVTHANALRLFAATDPWFGFGSRDVWTLFHSYAFDFSVWEIWGALLYGGRLVVVPYFVSRSPEAFADLLRRERVTVLNQTPSAFAALARAVLPVGEALSDLRTVAFGGEAISLRALEPWLDRFGEAPRLVNMYGITETTVHVTYRPLVPSDPRSGETPFGSPIGQPISDLAVHVVDRAGQPVPVGVPGEMRVGGAGLARGYLNRPGLTAERFVPDPFSGLPGTRLYRSGDLARRLPSGHLEFLGRADAQVKIRGFRIEPGEIEAAISRLPEVAACAVLPRKAPQGDTILAAYVVPRSGASLPAARLLREALLASLPEYMVPALFAEIPALPTTPSGKVDRGALARLDPSAVSGTIVAASAAPRTPVEEVLTGLFLEALGEERTGGRVGIYDDFFESGGHSLLATQVINRIRTAFGIDLPLRALFEGATPAALAPRVEAALLEAAGSPTARSAPPIVPVGRDHNLPLSFAQERLWFLDQMQPGGLYNIPLALRLAGRLDLAAWQHSLDEIRRRHETLRTRFRASGEAPVQVVDPAASLPLPLIDLAALPEAARERETRRLAQEEAGRAFDLTTGPLMRSGLVHLSEEDHLAFLTFHHIAADGWSLGVLLSELERLYTGASLPELPVQYADFAVWQRQWLSGEVLEAQLDYWRRELAGDPFLTLPSDRPVPAIQTFRGAAWTQTLSPELAAGLHNLGRRSGSTLFMVLLAAYTALLHRHTGDSEIAVGSPIAGRNRPEVEGLIGFFVNTLVLRSDLADGPAFDLLLDRTRETALGAYTHQDLPFEKLVEELRPERRLDQNPLFQVVLSLERPTVTSEWAGFHLRPFELASRSAKFDLNLAIVEEEGRLVCAWEYKTDLFDETTIARLAGHWETLLSDTVADPGQAVSRLALLTPSERHQIAAEWNDTHSTYPREATLPERFERQVRLRPEAVALVAGSAALTYRELDERAEHLASRLRGLGVGPEARVALALPRSFELIAAILGILKAGGAYVPLDPDYPAERLAFMLADSRAEVVVTRADLAKRLPVDGIPVLEVDEDRKDSNEGRDGVRIAADNLAYVMYTSGSTGTPKGVAVTHRNVIRLVEETGYAEMGPNQTFLQLSPVSFDASTLEIWAPLLHGGRLVLAPEGRVSLAELGEVIRAGGVTSMWLTAGLFHQMVDEEIEGLAGLRQLLAGGDVVSPPHARKVLERFPDLTLINGYGPTEGTTFSACHSMRSPAEVGSPVPIGQPIANARLHVLDARLEPVPAGVPGELYIGGDGLARGYLDRPSLTAERFVPAPQGEPGERLYRTGDLVRWLPDGRLEFLGRADLQVKVSGYRVELGEIESLLARHPSVGQSAVVVQDDPRTGRRLVAYVAPPPGAARPSSKDLRSWLKERLPEPMVPALFVPLDRLPLNPNGKVDRRALPAPGDPGVDSTEVAAAAPRTPMEELLATLWAEALGIDQPGRIGLHDDFFGLGGHSLLATRLVARIRQVFRADLSLRALFEAPTVASLAAILSRQLTEETGPPPPEIIALPREGEEPYFPASLAQRRLWILHQVAPVGFFLNVTHALRFRGALDPEVLRRALEEITHRHEPLRTTFANRDGQPVQRISPTAPLALPWIDLTVLSTERREAEASRIAQDEAARPFDLIRGPLARFALLRFASGEHVLILTPHHLVFDGRSMEILFGELATLYEAHLTGRPAPLAALPVQYADFAVWQREAMAGPALEAQLRYWKGLLSGVPPLELPLDRPRPAAGSFRGDWHDSELAPGLLERLAALCRRQGVTQFMALMAAVELFLARATNQSDFPIGTPIANRGRPEVEGLIGFFVNTLVLRADLSGAPSFLTLLERVRESALGAYTHQELPFESLVEELQPERQLTANPIFGVLFNMLDSPQPVDFPGVRVEAFEFALDLAHFDLMVTAMRGSRADAGALTLVLNHSRDLFDRTTARRLLDLLVRLLEGAVADPERPVWALPVFDAAVWHQVVREWNDTAGPLPERVTTERLIERCGREIPDALAVSAPGARLTYAELDDRANRLAHRLQRLGVGPEVTVALGFERSAELIVSALAVWKAGGAFLPLDLSAPADRLALVVEDAAAPLVITSLTTAERFAACPAKVLSFEVEAASLEQESAAPPRRASLPESRAYVIYTSGSTGRPKGVEVQHSSLFNLIVWQHRRFAITPASRVNLAAIPAFDASIYEIWPYLTAGASVHVPPAEITPSAREMLRWIAAERITHGYLTTPQADRALAAERPEELSDLRWILAGGDRLHQRPFRADSFDLINIYGPTEATVVTTCRQVTRMEDAPPRLPSIGAPLLNVAVHLLDHQLRPVPIGSLGELFIAGAGLARGYLGRPALTAERYVPHPFADEPGARLYKTGDLVRYLPDGRLDFVGRTDHQVKIRGFRIELGEIEAVLAAHPEVAEAVVVVRNEATGPRLVAYLVARDRARFPDVSAVRDNLRSKLPEYMVPSAFVVLDALPLTSRDKVDRAALPAPPSPGSDGGDGSASSAPLRSGTEERIAGVWREVLRIETVGGEDNFFDLGGHSLAMVAIHERLQSELGREFPLVEMFENPTIRALALALDRVLAGAPAEPAAERQDVQQRAEKQRTAQAWKDRARQARRTPR